MLVLAEGRARPPSRSPMSPRTKAIRSRMSVQVGQVPGVGEQVVGHDVVAGVVLGPVADEVGADEAGAAGDEESHGANARGPGRPPGEPRSSRQHSTPGGRVVGPRSSAVGGGGRPGRRWSAAAIVVVVVVTGGRCRRPRRPSGPRSRRRARAPGRPRPGRVDGQLGAARPGLLRAAWPGPGSRPGAGWWCARPRRVAGARDRVAGLFSAVEALAAAPAVPMPFSTRTSRRRRPGPITAVVVAGSSPARVGGRRILPSGPRSRRRAPGRRRCR